MPTSIDRDRLREMLASGAQLVEVLPKREYDHEHLVGARNLPLKQLTAETSRPLERSRPLVVYCWDSL